MGNLSSEFDLGASDRVGTEEISSKIAVMQSAQSCMDTGDLYYLIIISSDTQMVLDSWGGPLLSSHLFAGCLCFLPR